MNNNVTISTSEAEASLPEHWTLVPIPRGKKAPVKKAWQEIRNARPDPDAENIGVHLGPSGLVDIDLDCPEAIELAPRFLTATATFGRASRSHWLYTGEATYRKFVDPIDKQCLLEIRAGEGKQTLLPPSLHPEGDLIRWHDERKPQAFCGCPAVAKLAAMTWFKKHKLWDASNIPQRVRDWLGEAGVEGFDGGETAPAAAPTEPTPVFFDSVDQDLIESIVKCCPEGSRHDYRLACAGAMKRGGIGEASASDMLAEAMADSRLGDDRAVAIKDARSAVRDTYSTSRATTGARTLLDLGGQLIVDRIEALTAPAEFEACNQWGEGGLELSPAGNPFIVYGAKHFFLLGDDETYSAPLDQNALWVELERRKGSPLGIGIRGSSTDKRVSMPSLQASYMVNADELRASYLARSNTFDWESKTLTLSTLKWAPLEARKHDEVDDWLRALGGEHYERLAQWLASCPRLDRPAPMLYLHARKNAGKTLLAQGISHLWGRSPVAMADAIGDFNGACASMPLLFADEGFPPKLDFQRLRSMITDRTRSVNEKYQPAYDVEGCVRVIVAANNGEALRYQRTGSLTRADVDAIADRLLVIPGKHDAVEVLAACDTSAMAKFKIAEHVLWLAESVPLAKGRMVAQPHGGEALVLSLATPRVAKVLEALEALSQSAGEPSGEADAFIAEDGALWFKAPIVAARADVPLQDVDEACQLLAPDSGGVKGDPSRGLRRFGGRHSTNLRFRRVDLERLQELCEFL